MVKAKIRVQTIDCTPTWESLIPAFKIILESGTPAAKAVVWEEIARIARFADHAKGESEAETTT